MITLRLFICIRILENNVYDRAGMLFALNIFAPYVLDLFRLIRMNCL
jgi:hypothetical protein